jgi:hypothetical protein
VTRVLLVSLIDNRIFIYTYVCIYKYILIVCFLFSFFITYFLFALWCLLWYDNSLCSISAFLFLLFFFVFILRYIHIFIHTSKKTNLILLLVNKQEKRETFKNNRSCFKYRKMIELRLINFLKNPFWHWI